MAEVYRTDFYEWPFDREGEKIKCENCGKEMTVKPMDDINRDMKQPYWLQFNNIFKSACEKCWGDYIFGDLVSFGETDNGN